MSEQAEEEWSYKDQRIEDWQNKWLALNSSSARVERELREELAAWRSVSAAFEARIHALEAELKQAREDLAARAHDGTDLAAVALFNKNRYAALEAIAEGLAAKWKRERINPYMGHMYDECMFCGVVLPKGEQFIHKEGCALTAWQEHTGVAK